MTRMVMMQKLPHFLAERKMLLGLKERAWRAEHGA